jgi:hypothetical protein
LFLKRIEIHHAHYLVLNVNELPFKLQEVCYYFARGNYSVQIIGVS